MEKDNIKMLSSSALLVSVVIIGFMLLQWYWAPSYAFTGKEVASQINNGQALVLPWQLKGMAEKDELKNYTLVVLLESQNTEAGLFKNQKTIAFDQILDKDKLNFFKKNQPVMITAGTESQALMAVHLIRSKGIINVYAIANDVAMNVRHNFSNFKPAQSDMHSEKAAFDYGRFFKSEGSPGAKQSTKHEIPQGGVTVVKTQGGCS